MKRNRIRAFTLIELMVALGITAILMGMSYPAYVAYEARAERSRAEVALTALAAKLEVYFGENGRYKGATIGSLNGGELTQGLHYHLKIAKISDEHYTIEAIPQGVQYQRDKRCGALSLTDANERGISGEGDVVQCWL